MPYDLEKIPLVFKSKRRSFLAFGMFFIFLGVAPLALVEGLFYSQSHQLTLSLMHGLAAILLVSFPILAGVWFCVTAYTNNDMLVIDSEGVRVRARGKERSYKWSEINEFKAFITEPSRSRRSVVSIKRKSDMGFTFDARANALWGNFSVDQDRLRATLEEAKARWGDPAN
jgi:hypothetical protein